MSFERHLDQRRAMLAAIGESRIASAVGSAADILETAAHAGRMIMACGNGGSASDAEHIVAELVGRFLRTRPALKAVSLTGNSASLTAIANDFGFELAFSRQVEALAEPGGVLIVLSTSGASASVVKAAQAARTAGIAVIALTGAKGGPLADLADVWINVPGSDAAVVQDGHRIIYHYICNRIDASVAAGAAEVR